MIKSLALVFVSICIAGILAGKLAVTLLALPMLLVLWYASKLFAQQDEEYARLHPPCPTPSEVALEDSSCSYL